MGLVNPKITRNSMLNNTKKPQPYDVDIDTTRIVTKIVKMILEVKRWSP
jgi:hypothetical protein